MQVAGNPHDGLIVHGAGTGPAAQVLVDQGCGDVPQTARLYEAGVVCVVRVRDRDTELGSQAPGGQTHSRRRLGGLSERTSTDVLG